MSLFICSPVVAADDGLEDFVTTYECSLANVIAKIHAHPGKPGDNVRFVALTLPSPEVGFVRCIFEPGDYRVVCEGTSDPWGKRQPLRFNSAQTWALEQLGYQVFDTAGVFRKELSFPGENFEPNALADLMLRSLYDGYGARTGMTVEIATTFALRNAVLPQQRCVPIS